MTSSVSIISASTAEPTAVRLGRPFDASMFGLMVILPLLVVIFPRSAAFIPEVAALFGLGLYRLLAKGQWPAMHRGAFFWAAAVFLLIALSSLWSLDPSLSFDRALRILPVMLGVAGLMTLTQALERDLALSIVSALPWVLLVGAVICAADLFFGAPFASLTRTTAKMVTNNNYSFLNRSIVCLALLSVPVLLFAKQSGLLGKAGRAAVYGLGAGLIVVLFKTASQSAHLALALALLAFFIFPAGRKKAWWALMGLVSALMMFAPMIAIEMFSYLPPLVKDVRWLQDGYAASRMEIWDFVARRAMESPLLGFGAEATQMIKDFDFAALYHKKPTVLHPHNFALQLWIEFGVLGAIVGAAFLCDVLRRIAASSVVVARVQLAVFMAGISVAATGYGLWQGWWIGMLGLLGVYGALYARALAKPLAGAV